MRGIQPGAQQKHAGLREFRTCWNDSPSSCELLVQHQLLLARVVALSTCPLIVATYAATLFCRTAQHSSIGFEHRHSSLNTVICDTASQQQHTRSNTLRCAPNSYTITCNGSKTLMFSVVAAPAPHCVIRSLSQGRNQSTVVSDSANRAIGAIGVPGVTRLRDVLRATRISCNLLVITCNPLLACVVELRPFTSAIATPH
jgi:hypothetical protein